MLAEDRRAMPPARRRMIKDHRDHADKHNPALPYDIGIFRPKIGHSRRDIEFECSCGHLLWIAQTTCSIICPACKSLQSVK